MVIDNGDDGDLSGTEENDEELDDDMEELRRACILAGTSFDDVKKENKRLQLDDEGGGDLESGSEEDDLELLRNVQSRFLNPEESYEAISLEPLCALPPVLDDDDDDFETLCAIQRRFDCYNNDGIENFSKDAGRRINESSVDCDIEVSDDSVVDRKVACEVVPEAVEAVEMSDRLTDKLVIEPFVEWHGSDTCKLSGFAMNYSSFPNSAKLLLDAIKKNRSCQRFLQSKLTQIEARMEENKKLRERVKILKDFQARCKKVTGRAFSQEKDPRIQLISARRTLPAKYAKLNDKTVIGRYSGPLENSHVANYRLALSHFPLLWKQKPWSKAERENLGKGLRQQFQEMVLQVSVDQLSESEGSCGDTNNLDGILASIRDLDIAPERIREFIPKVNWDQLASLYVPSRSGAECEARWLNFEDPLINRSPWTRQEDKKILFVVQEKGITDWFDIATSLGTNRTPFQCLARFQRSLNARILRREWTEDEDRQLRAAVELYGEGAWQTVASTLGGRTGSQCSNRWMKSLHPDRSRIGRWTLDEDKRLKVAVKLFGPKNWKRIAHFVPGRTQVQCRERWANKHDPSLNFGEWTEEEDLRLKVAIEENGYCWSKISECLPGRNDNQCLRRWKVLFPDEMALHQASRRTQKAALISNFVDREEDRPALGPSDFVPLQLIASPPELKNMVKAKKRKRKPREQDCTTAKEKNAEADVVLGNALKRLRPRRPSKTTQVPSEKARGQTGGADKVNTGGDLKKLRPRIPSKTTQGPSEKARGQTGGADKENTVGDLKILRPRRPNKTTQGPSEKARGQTGGAANENTGGDFVDLSNTMFLPCLRRNNLRKLPKQIVEQHELFVTQNDSQGVLLASESSGSMLINGDNWQHGGDNALDSGTTLGVAGLVDNQKGHRLVGLDNQRLVDLDTSFRDGDSQLQLKMKASTTQSGNTVEHEVSPDDGLEARSMRSGDVENSALNETCPKVEKVCDCRRKRRKKRMKPKARDCTSVMSQTHKDKKLKSKSRFSRQELGTHLEDNITLASLFCKTREKRPNIAGSACQNTLSSTRAEQLSPESDIQKELSIPQSTPSHDISTHHSILVQAADNAQDVSLVNVINFEAVALKEKALDAVTSHDCSLEDSDMTLKSFLCKRQKKNVEDGDITLKSYYLRKWQKKNV